MSKKLLLSTAISSALLLTSAASAVDYNISFDGTKYDVNGTKFDGVLAVAQHMKTIITDGDNAILGKNIPYAVLNEFKNKDITEQEFVEIYAESLDDGTTPEQILNDLPSFISLIEILEVSKQFGFEAEDIIDFIEENDLSKDDVLQFLADANSIESLLQTENLSAEDSDKIKKLVESLTKNTAISEIRKSAFAQEKLKNEVEDIKTAIASEKNDSELYKAKIAKLETMMSLFMDKNPTSGANVSPVQKPDTAVSDAMMNTSMVTRTLIDSRINNFSAVAAGDIAETFGVWAKGSFTQAMQKAFGGTDGYIANQKGVTVGVDTGDEALIGLAYSFYKNDVKNKTTKANKEAITSHTISAYGKIDLTNEVFASGQIQYGLANIKKKRATGDINNNIATAKTKAKTIAGKAEVGYVFDTTFNNIHVIPTAGVAYTNVDVKGYSESGKGLNRKVGKRTSNRTSGIAGLMIKHVANIGDMKFIPEMHANIDYAFNTKNSSTKVTILDGIAPIATPSQKLTKAYYNVGTSVKAIQSDMFEVSAGYDLGLAKKFKSHTGTLKVRVNL
jgi:outer membrane autotransporter protein